ncbi:unnamed protein product, partial [Symbiodinium microadriaticum]
TLMTRSHENVNDGTDLRLNIWNAWMNFVLNYVMPKKMRTGYVMSPSIGDKKPNITNRRTIMKTITEKVKKKKKKQCHPPSRSLTSAQVDLAVVDLMDLQETTVKISIDSWMSHCIANVLGACADPNHEEWIAWLNPAFRPSPDIDGLTDSGHLKFTSIDIKLGIAMAAMLKAAGDTALELYLDVNRKSSKYVREESKLIKGRQIIAMVYESFRTRDRLDMIVTLEYLIKLQYQGCTF